VIKARHGVIDARAGSSTTPPCATSTPPQPIGTDWTVGAKENTGDGIRGFTGGCGAGPEWRTLVGPAIPIPGTPYFCLAERHTARRLMINSAGQRFVNEAAPYSDVVHVMYDRPGSADIPAC